MNCDFQSSFCKNEHEYATVIHYLPPQSGEPLRHEECQPSWNWNNERIGEWEELRKENHSSRLSYAWLCWPLMCGVLLTCSDCKESLEGCDVKEIWLLGVFSDPMYQGQSASTEHVENLANSCWFLAYQLQLISIKFRQTWMFSIATSGWRLFPPPGFFHPVHLLSFVAGLCFVRH